MAIFHRRLMKKLQEETSGFHFVRGALRNLMRKEQGGNIAINLEATLTSQLARARGTAVPPCRFDERASGEGGLSHGFQ